MRYFKQYFGKTERKEITYDEALFTLLGSWKDCDLTRDLLTIPNRIQCGFSYVEVEDDKGNSVVDGVYNMLPMNVYYDDNGQRLD